MNLPEFLGKTFLTSLTDNREYPDYCLQAALNSDVFQDFRRNEIYNFALEHDSYEQGLEYLEAVRQSKFNLLAVADKFRDNDKFGNPIVYEYEGIGTFSPTTLRYIKILSDLEAEFGSLDNLNICEIGVGYGGLCRLIDSYFKVKSYTLVDLKPVLMLAQKYLDNYILHTSLVYRTMNELSTEIYDLVISNYAFTEMRREIQNIYLKKIIYPSLRGYITYNDGNPKDFNSYKKEELAKIIRGIKEMPEVGILYETDCILAWHQ